MTKLSVGETIPDFRFRTASGKELSFSAALKGSKRTVFWVLRYVGCTSCRYDLHVLAGRYAELEAAGAKAYVVLQSPAESIAEYYGSEGLPPFEVITDPDEGIYRSFSIEAAPDKESMAPKSEALAQKLAAKRERIKELGLEHGKYEGNELQLPALFLLDESGEVLYSHYAQSTIDMPTFDELLGILGGLSA
jgi:peroxiredoxin